MPSASSAGQPCAHNPPVCSSALLEVQFSYPLRQAGLPAPLLQLALNGCVGSVRCLGVLPLAPLLLALCHALGALAAGPAHLPACNNQWLPLLQVCLAGMGLLPVARKPANAGGPIRQAASTCNKAGLLGD